MLKVLCFSQLLTLEKHVKPKFCGTNVLRKIQHVVKTVRISIPSEVCVLRTGLFQTSFNDPHNSLNVSLQITTKPSPSNVQGDDLFRKELLQVIIWDHTYDLKYLSSTWFRQHLPSAGIIISHLGKS